MNHLPKALLSRRGLLFTAAAALALPMVACNPAPAPPSQNQGALTDLKGRPVALPAGAKLAIDDGRFMIALALIHADPVSVLAAWPGDIPRIGPALYAEFAKKFPAIEALPRIASSAQDFNLEAVLAATPSVFIASLGSGLTDAQVAQLEGAGVPVVFIDFFNSPFQNQEKSLALLGALTGAEQRAGDYNAFRSAKLKVISDKVAGLAADARPTVLMEAHAGMTPDCCNSPGKGNVGDYIDFVGGHNIGADVLTTPSGKLNLEYVIERNPDIYIATGGPHLAKPGGFVIGPGFTEAQARASLNKVASRPGVATLKAVSDGKVYGVAHQILNSPIDIVTAEALAKWIHPELFADLDPRATLNEINQRFLAVPYAGDYWIALTASRPSSRSEPKS